MQPTADSGTPGPSLFRANTALLGMASIWALNFSIAKDALATIPPLAFNALRFPLAALVVTLVMARRTGIRLPPRSDRLALLLLGLLSNVVYQLLFIYGLANSRAGTASVLLSGTPVVTALLSAAIGHEHVARAVWVGAVATVAGIILVVAGSPSVAPGENALLGNVLLLGATFAWAVYSIASRNLILKHGAVPVTTWTLWGGTLVIVIIGAPSVAALDFATLSLRDGFAVFYAGALSIGVAYVLWSYGVRHLGPTRTALYSNLVPVLALLGAWILLREGLSPAQIAGAAVIIAGVTAAQLRRRVQPLTPRIPTP